MDGKNGLEPAGGKGGANISKRSRFRQRCCTRDVAPANFEGGGGRRYGTTIHGRETLHADKHVAKTGAACILYGIGFSPHRKMSNPNNSPGSVPTLCRVFLCQRRPSLEPRLRVWRRVALLSSLPRKFGQRRRVWGVPSAPTGRANFHLPPMWWRWRPPSFLRFWQSPSPPS